MLLVSVLNVFIPKLCIKTKPRVHCVDIPQFVHAFTCWWAFGLFPVGAITDEVAFTVHGQVFAGTCGFISPG